MLYKTYGYLVMKRLCRKVIKMHNNTLKVFYKQQLLFNFNFYKILVSVAKD